MGLRLAHPSPLGVESISSGCHAAAVTDRVSVRLSGEQFAFVGGNTTHSGAVVSKPNLDLRPLPRSIYSPPEILTPEASPLTSKSE